MHGNFYRENMVPVAIPINQEFESQRADGAKKQVLVNGRWHNLVEYVLSHKNGTLIHGNQFC